MASPNTNPVDIRIIAGGGISNVLQHLAPLFERETGHTLTITYDGTPAIVRRFEAGEAFDLVLIPQQAYFNPAAPARLAPQPQVDIARVGVGLGVREGAHILKVFERLGIAEAMKAKMLVQSDPLELGPALARGDAEIGLYVTNLLLAPGIALVGQFPGDLNTHLTFTAGLSREAAQPDAARAFIAYLTTPAAAATIKTKGMEPLF